MNRRLPEGGRKPPFAGPLLMLSSSFLFAVLWLLIKLLGPPFRVWDIAIFRLGGGALVLLLFFSRGRKLFRPVRPYLMVIRGVVGSIAFILLVLAVQRLPFSTTMVFFYSFPAFSALFSPLLFGDRIGGIEIGCLATAIAGLAVLYDFTLAGTLTGQLMAVGSALFAGLTISLIQKLRETNGPVIIYFYLCLIGTFIAAGPFLADPRIPEKPWQWAVVAAILVTSIVAQLLMNEGFKYCKSWEGGVLMTSEVIFSTLFGVYLLGETVGWRFWAGAVMIVGSAAAMNLRHRDLPAPIPPAGRPPL
ncbi:MAG: DMT family transporter [Desulfobacterales bacterium]